MVKRHITVFLHNTNEIPRSRKWSFRILKKQSTYELGVTTETASRIRNTAAKSSETLFYQFQKK